MANDDIELERKNQQTDKPADHELGCDVWTLGKCDCSYREVWETRKG